MSDAESQPPTAGDLKALIRDIPDFPRPGMVFRDATPLLADAAALSSAVDLLSASRPWAAAAASARPPTR
jgi:adenine phosphoribosyltransferase